MTDIIVNLQLRKMDDGSFQATSPECPELSVSGASPAEAVEKATLSLQSMKLVSNDSEPVTENGVPDPEDKVDEPRQNNETGGPAAGTLSEEEKILRQAMILHHVESTDQISQRQIAKLMNLNLSTVNQVIKRLIRKGYVTTSRLNGRSLAYSLTPQGLTEKMRLVVEYVRLTIGLFSSLRATLNLRLKALVQEQGVRTAAIVGMGEIAEAAYLSALEAGLDVVCFYSPDDTKEEWLGHPVCWPVTQQEKMIDILLIVDSVSMEGLDMSVEDPVHSWVLLKLDDLLSEEMLIFAEGVVARP